MVWAQRRPYVVHPTPTISQRYNGLPTLAQRSFAIWGFHWPSLWSRHRKGRVFGHTDPYREYVKTSRMNEVSVKVYIHLNYMSAEKRYSTLTR